MTFKIPRAGDPLVDGRLASRPWLRWFGEIVERIGTPYHAGKLIQSQALSANTTTLIEHDLGRAYSGAHVVSCSARAVDVAVYRASAQSIDTGVWDKIDFDTEVRDVGGDFDTGTAVFTAPEDMDLEIFARVWWDSSIGDGSGIGLRVLAGSTQHIFHLDATGAAGSNKIQSGSMTLRVTEGQEIQIDATQSSGLTKSLQVGTFQNTAATFRAPSPSVFVDSSSGANSSIYVPMRSNRDCVVDLWVY